MADKKGGAIFRGIAGYDRLPSRTSAGTKANFNKALTKDTRAAMQGIIHKVESLFNQTKGLLPEVMEQSLEPTFAKSQNYCPVDTGKLLDSGNLYVDSFKERPRVTISYGGGGTVHYAALVHEFTHLHHKPPTRSKFLQAALEEDYDNILPRIQRALKVGI